MPSSMKSHCDNNHSNCFNRSTHSQCNSLVSAYNNLPDSPQLRYPLPVDSPIVATDLLLHSTRSLRSARTRRALRAYYVYVALRIRPLFYSLRANNVCVFFSNSFFFGRVQALGNAFQLSSNENLFSTQLGEYNSSIRFRCFSCLQIYIHICKYFKVYIGICTYGYAYSSTWQVHSW